MERLDILAIAAHPDDVELSCAATLAKEKANGKRIGILDLTRGELGTRGSAQIRAKESAKAAEILGLDYRHNLGFPDGFFLKEEKELYAIIEQIRITRPRIILCNAPQDRHPDHGRAGELAVRAAFLSGLPKIEISGTQAYRPEQVFHYIQWESLQPDFIVDVTGFVEVKLQACLAYASQFYDPNSTEPETPISSKNFSDSIGYRALDMGRLIHRSAGEGFLRAKSAYLGVDGLDVFLGS